MCIVEVRHSKGLACVFAHAKTLTEAHFGEGAVAPK